MASRRDASLRPLPLMFSFFRKKTESGSPWETQRMPDVVPTAEPA